MEQRHTHICENWLIEIKGSLKRQAFAGSQYRHVRRFGWLHRCSACGITCPLWRNVRWTFREERTFLTAGKDTTAHRVGGE